MRVPKRLKVPKTYTPFGIFCIGPAVGNSPLNLDESSDHGLGQRYEDIWMQSSGTGNLPGPGVIVPKTRQRFRPEHGIPDF
jgi:hypothetical protein